MSEIYIVILVSINIIALVVLAVCVVKNAQYKKSLADQQELIDKMEKMQRQVTRITEEEDVLQIFGSVPQIKYAFEYSRFNELTRIDEFYKENGVPATTKDFDLETLCDSFRNYVADSMHVYCDIKVVREFLAAMASSKIIIFRDSTECEKSFPYAWSKFTEREAVSISSKTSWNEKSETLGYFNEFTKKYHETDMLKQFYEAGYVDEVILQVFDNAKIPSEENYFTSLLAKMETDAEDSSRVSIVSDVWENDPIKLDNGTMKIPGNIWYVGTAKSISGANVDKIYDKAVVVECKADSTKFKTKNTEPMRVSMSRLNELFAEAKEKYPLSDKFREKISRLDIYMIEHMQIAFGKNVMLQMLDFVPVYVACGGTEGEAVDYILMTKVFCKLENRKHEFICDKIDDLITYLNDLFGKSNMKASKKYLKELKLNKKNH